MNCNRHLTGELRQAINSLAGDNTDTKALIAAAKAQIRVIKDSIKEDEKLLNAEKKRILKLWRKEQGESSNAEELQKTEAPVTDNAKKTGDVVADNEKSDGIWTKTIKEAIGDTSYPSWAKTKSQRDAIDKDFAYKKRSYFDAVEKAIKDGKQVPDKVLVQFPSWVRPDLNESQVDEMVDDVSGIKSPTEQLKAMKEWEKSKSSKNQTSNNVADNEQADSTKDLEPKAALKMTLGKSVPVIVMKGGINGAEYTAYEPGFRTYFTKDGRAKQSEKSGEDSIKIALRYKDESDIAFINDIAKKRLEKHRETISAERNQLENERLRREQSEKSQREIENNLRQQLLSAKFVKGEFTPKMDSRKTGGAISGYKRNGLIVHKSLDHNIKGGQLWDVSHTKTGILILKNFKSLELAKLAAARIGNAADFNDFHGIEDAKTNKFKKAIEIATSIRKNDSYPLANATQDELSGDGSTNKTSNTVSDNEQADSTKDLEQIFASLDKHAKTEASQIEHPQAELIANIQNHWTDILQDHGFYTKNGKMYDMAGNQIDAPKAVEINKSKGCL